MSTTATPKTPHAKTSEPQDQGTKVTPYNAGSASHVSYHTQTAQEEYKDYLATDIAGAQTIPFATFLDIAFSPLDWRAQDSEFKAIATSSDFQKLLKQYQATAGHETQLYHPFNKLTNHIIEELSSQPHLRSAEESIVVCRNDHVTIKGSFARRIPDCVVVSKKASEHPNRINWDSMSKNGPIGEPFHWSELLAFVEFKVGERLQTPSKPRHRKKPTRKGSGMLRPKQLRQSSVSSTSSLLSRANGPASAVASTSGAYSTAASTSSGAYSTAASTSSGPSPALEHSPYIFGSRGSTSSQKRSGDDLESPLKKQLKGKQPEEEETVALSKHEVMIQCASYALEMLSHGGLRSHVLSAVVTDCEIELLYYDRSMPVVSEVVDFHKDPSSLIALMYCMQHSTPSQWGRVTKITLDLDPLSDYDPKPAPNRFSARFKPAQPIPEAALTQVKPHPLRGALLTLANGAVLLLGELVFVQHALIGRGTCVVRATVVSGCPDSWKNVSIVVKFSFAPTTRTREGEILSKILGIAEKPEYAWVINNLPTVLHYETVKLDAKETDTQSRMSAYFKSEKKQYEDRVLQILVMTELFPVTQLKTSEELLPVIRDVFKCYKWLYKHARVIHRDISLNNIMYRKEVNEDGSIVIHGVLSDYDLSIFFDEPRLQQTSRQRTGTRPYMAIDLLQPSPTQHLYRHDLESLFYVIVVFTSRYDGGEEIENPPLQAWFDLGPVELSVAKTNALTSTYPAPQYQIPEPTPSFSKMAELIFKMQTLFRRGYATQADYASEVKQRSKITSDEPLPEYDDTTLGGHVDFKKFEELLELSTDDSDSE